MKRRLALGIADPVVANRFLLWGLGGLCASTIVLSSIPMMFLGTAHWASQVCMLTIGFLGTLATITYGLAFFPPKSYFARLQNAST